MSVDTVKNYFKSYGMDDRVQEFSDSSATVSDAAKRLGCSQDEIAKSLSFQLKNSVILIVMAGNCRVDNQKFKGLFNQKAKMLKFDEVEELIGHPPGGVCPFAVNEGVKVYLDVSLKNYEYVYPACGSENSAIRLSIDELEKYVDHFTRWVDVCK